MPTNSPTSTAADMLALAVQRVTHIGEAVVGHPIAEKRAYELILRFETLDEMRTAGDAIRATKDREGGRA